MLKQIKQIQIVRAEIFVWIIVLPGAAAAATPDKYIIYNIYCNNILKCSEFLPLNCPKRREGQFREPKM